MASDTWTGAAGDNWQFGGSWSTGNAPGAGDDATVPANTPLADIDTNVGTVASLTDAGNVELDEGSMLSAGSLVVTDGGVLHAELGGADVPATIMIGAGGVSNAAGVTGVNNGVGGDISLTGDYDSSNQPTANSPTMIVGTQAGFGTNGHLTGQVYLSNGHIQFSSGAIQSIDANSTLTLYGGGSISSGAPSDTNSALIGLSNVAGELIVENSSVNTGSGTYTADTVTIGNHLTVSGQIAADNFVISNGGNLEITATGSITYPPGQISSHGDVSPVTFAGGGTLTFDAPAPAAGYHTGPLVDFGIGTTLDLTGLTYARGAVAVLAPNGRLTVTSDGVTEGFGTMTPTATSFVAEPDGTGGTKVVAGVVCFASGTSIRTPAGDVAVECLAVGDLVVTAAGEHRAIRWLGQRTIDCNRHPDPLAARPVRILAQAFGPNLPARDLYLSPGHPVLVGADADGNGGHLVPVMCLVNGTTIDRTKADEVTYWHVELDAHDILLAEGLPAESYIDLGSRPWFGGADGALSDPDLVLAGQPGRCRPVAVDGPVVEAERRRLDAVLGTRLHASSNWPQREADLLF